MKVLLIVLFIAFCYATVQVNKDWIMTDERANPESIYKFNIALKLRNTEKLEKIVLDISNPKSPRYTNWLTRDQIETIVAPEEHIPKQIMEYLKNECSDFELENLKDAIKVSGPVRCAEKVFGVRLMKYVYPKTGLTVVRRHIEDNHPSLPAHLDKHISFMSGVSALPKIRKDLPTKSAEKAPNLAYNFNIPATMRSLYNIPPGTKGTNSKNSQSVMEFYPEGGPLWSDLQEFSQQAGEAFNNVTRVIGPYNPGSSDGESTLDIQYITTVGAGVSTFYITIPDGWIYDMASTIFTLNDPPLVVSVSYGWMESQTCESDVTNANCTGIDAQTYVQRANQELMKVAGLGVSMVVCAQDEGAPSDNNEDCSLDTTYPLWPIYPSSSQWVTTVSSTSYASNGVQTNAPKICNQGYSCSGIASRGDEVFTMANNTYYIWTGGSGFANYTARPSWQSSQVTRWLSGSTSKTWPIPPTVFFNPNNRAYPDVVALGDRILIIMGGSVSVTAGTSASTPIFAGIVALLNDARLNAGKKPLGFLNPMLYQMQTTNGDTFHDITQGSSSWSRASYSCKYGFGCSTGWDPASGLGSLNYQNAVKYVTSLP